MKKSDPRKTVIALVQAAGAGKADAAWLDAAIRRAGYVRKGERTTRAEVEAALKAVVRVIEDIGLECAGTCGEDWLDKVQKGIEIIGGRKPEKEVNESIE